MPAGGQRYGENGMSSGISSRSLGVTGVWADVLDIAFLGAGFWAMNKFAPTAPQLGGPKKTPFDIPSSDEGIPVADVLGTSQLAGNFLWYGYNRSKKVDEEVPTGKGGGGEAGSSITGYKYFLSWAHAICAGPVDHLYTIWRDDKILWHGNLTPPPSGDYATINIDNYGRIDFYFGTWSQTAWSQIGAKVGATVNPPYNGTCYALFRDCKLGRTNRVPNMKFVVSKRPAISFNGRHEIGTHGYNPAHAIYYILTTMAGINTAYIDATSFSTAAETLYAEGRGISVALDRIEEARSYVENILTHIDAGLCFNEQFKLQLKLFRDDIAVGEIPVIGADEILDAPTINRPDFIDTKNVVKVTFPSMKYKHDDQYKIKFKDRTVASKDHANIKLQERQVLKPVNLPLFNDAANAGWACHRILRSVCFPYASLNFTGNRKLFRYQVGDVFGLDYSRYNFAGNIFRITAIQEEGIESEKIIIDAVEDPWYYGRFADVSPGIGTGEYFPDPSLDPLAKISVAEPPYIQDKYPGCIIPLAGREDDEDGFIVYAGMDGSSYEPIMQGDYAVFGWLMDSPAAVWPNLHGAYPLTNKIDDDNGFYVWIEKDAERIQTISRERMVAGDNIAILQTMKSVSGAAEPPYVPRYVPLPPFYDPLACEMISFQTIEPTEVENVYKIIGIQRGLFGSKMKEFWCHYSAPDWTNPAFFYLGKFENLALLKNLRKINEGATRYFKIVPIENTFIGDISEAAAFSKTIAQISTYPAAPGQIFANGKAIGAIYTYGYDVSITWRTALLGSTFGAGFGDPFTSLDAAAVWDGLFQIKVYCKNNFNDDFILKRTTTDINAKTWTYTYAMQIADGGPWAYLRFDIDSYFPGSGPNYVHNNDGSNSIVVRRI